MPRDDPDDLLRRLGSALHDLSWAVRQVDADSPGLPPLPPTEFEVMRYVDRHAGASVGQVAQGLDLRQSNVSAAVRGLLARGLVRREVDPRDRRITRLHSTAVAAERRERTEQGWSWALVAGLSRLSDGDGDAVRAAVAPLERLAAELREPDGSRDD